MGSVGENEGFSTSIGSIRRENPDPKPWNFVIPADIPAHASFKGLSFKFKAINFLFGKFFHRAKSNGLGIQSSGLKSHL